MTSSTRFPAEVSGKQAPQCRPRRSRRLPQLANNASALAIPPAGKTRSALPLDWVLTLAIVCPLRKAEHALGGSLLLRRGG